MVKNHPIVLVQTILAVAFLALSAREVSAHPGSGIVVDEKGQVFFQDSVGRVIWKIDAQGKLTKGIPGKGGHWMCLDTEGSFSRADLKLFERITPVGVKPALVFADGGSPLAVCRDGNLYYSSHISPDSDMAPGGQRLTRMSPDGGRTPFAPALEKTLAKFDEGVTGLAAGPDGSLYVASPSAVLKVKMDGAVMTLVHPVVVTDCDENPAEVRRPYLRGLDVTPDGTVFVAATGCRCVVKVTPDGRVSTVMRAERPWSPTGVAVHRGEVYVLEYTNPNGAPADGWLPRVRKLGGDGKITILATVSRGGGDP